MMKMTSGRLRCLNVMFWCSLWTQHPYRYIPANVRLCATQAFMACTPTGIPITALWKTDKQLPFLWKKVMSVDIKTQEQLFFFHPTCLRKHFRLDSSLNTHASHVGFLTKPNTTFRSAVSRAEMLYEASRSTSICEFSSQNCLQWFRRHSWYCQPAASISSQITGLGTKNSSQEQEQQSTVAEIIKKCFNTKGDN